MSAIEQPAREVGQDDLLVVGGEDVGGLGHEVHAAEDDVLGLRARRGLLGELEGVTGDVGELDDLVALVVVAEDEDPVAERRLRRAARSTSVGSQAGGQVARAVDAPLAVGSAAAAEHQQQRRAGGDAVGAGRRSVLVTRVLPAETPPCHSNVAVHANPSADVGDPVRQDCRGCAC